MVESGTLFVLLFIIDLFISEEKSKVIFVDLYKFVVILSASFDEEISFESGKNSDEIFVFSLSLIVESILGEIKLSVISKEELDVISGKLLCFISEFELVKSSELPLDSISVNSIIISEEVDLELISVDLSIFVTFNSEFPFILETNSELISVFSSNEVFITSDEIFIELLGNSFSLSLIVESILGEIKLSFEELDVISGKVLCFISELNSEESPINLFCVE